MTWQEYANQLLSSDYSQNDLALIEKAFNFALETHKEHKRLNGEPYILHPIRVSLKAAELQLGTETIAAALLHDVSEENGVLTKNLKKEFGQEIMFLVKGLTKVNKIKYRGMERSAESMRKMFMAMAQDIRVVIIKLLDRLNNLETLNVFPEEKQKRIALETLEVYAPVADRLGMGEIKAQLEDLAFKYAYPDEYNWIIKETREKVPEREAYLAKIIPLVEKEIEKEGVKIQTINYRAKHYYSLWKKLLKNNMDWYLIYDLAAVRIVVNSIEDCYAVLGTIHKLWKPLPGRIKDYIALPKQNGYQSLHTTVFADQNKITEFQIRTPEMHDEAEYGIASHWAYKMAERSISTKEMAHKKFYWINQLQEWHKKFNKNTTGKEFLENLKIDFFKDRVFVLTPKGDVIDLPEGATPIDFAYHIHSEVGNSIVAAKINNKIVPLSYELASGDMVEILTQKNKKPNVKWLEYVKTSIAASHIKSALKKQGFLANIKTKKPTITKIELVIIAEDRIGMMKDITSAIAAFKINIQNINTKKLDACHATILLIFTPNNKEQLNKVITRLKNIPDVAEVNYRAVKN